MLIAGEGKLGATPWRLKAVPLALPFKIITESI